MARYGVVLSLFLLIIVFSIARPDVFPTVGNFLSILNQVSILGMIALGLTVCLVMGLFDLSIGAMATLGGYAASTLLAEHLAEPGMIDVIWVVILVIAMSALVGMLNGTLVSYLGISAFIETLAMGSIITGAILGVSKSRTVLRGIPEEFHKKVFQKFEQVDSSDIREKAGTGLGLNIAQGLVQRHGGELCLESKVGVGTTFYFDIVEQI